MLRSVRTVIVDEIHAVARDKRGSHLALSLERLEHLAAGDSSASGSRRRRKPIEDIAAFLAGTRHPSTDTCIIDSGHARTLDWRSRFPPTARGGHGAEVWEEIYERLVQLISSIAPPWCS